MVKWIKAVCVLDTPMDSFILLLFHSQKDLENTIQNVKYVKLDIYYKFPKIFNTWYLLQIS